MFAFLCFSCAVAAKAGLGDFDDQSGSFLALSSRHGVTSNSRDEAGTEYERETQSPMVWLNLHKSSLNAKSSWPSVAYEDYASQRLGETRPE